MPIGYENGEHVVRFGTGDVAIGIMAIDEQKRNAIGFVPIEPREVGSDVSYAPGMECPIILHFSNRESLAVCIGRLITLLDTYGDEYPGDCKWPEGVWRTLRGSGEAAVYSAYIRIGWRMFKRRKLSGWSCCCLCTWP